MQLLGLTWAGASAGDIRTSATALLAEQRPDGGWAQLPTLETDAYATGQALVALQTAGPAVSSAEYRRGVADLLRTQFADGSWLVRSRTFPVQPLRDRVPSRKASVDLRGWHELGGDGAGADTAATTGHRAVIAVAAITCGRAFCGSG
jgi:hypothetical protein